MALKVKVSNNTLTSNFIYKIKTSNAAGLLSSNPVNAPTAIASPVSDLSGYSNTEAMLANTAAAYNNAVAFAATSAGNVYVSSIKDVVANSSPANNSTLVYNTSNNKYIVTPYNSDGGLF